MREDTNVKSADSGLDLWLIVYSVVGADEGIMGPLGKVALGAQWSQRFSQT